MEVLPSWNILFVLTKNEGVDIRPVCSCLRGLEKENYLCSPRGMSSFF